jgi:hypothetical protein
MFFHELGFHFFSGLWLNSEWFLQTGISNSGLFQHRDESSKAMDSLKAFIAYEVHLEQGCSLSIGSRKKVLCLSGAPPAWNSLQAGHNSLAASRKMHPGLSPSAPPAG